MRTQMRLLWKYRIDAMMELVLAMLGLGALRTVEKLNGRSK